MDSRARSESASARLVARLKTLAQIESPSGDVPASTEMADAIAPALADAGAAVERVPSSNGVHLVARIPGRRPGRILLLGHSDTVWDRGSISGAVPWREFVTETGVPAIAGPGVFDMKSGIVIIEEALARVNRDDGAHPEIRVVITCDEEIGSPTSTELVRAEAAKATAVIGFESPHPDGALKIGRKGSTRIRLDVQGVEAHAALDPEKGANAIDELLDQLVRVRAQIAAALHRRPDGLLYNLGGIDGGGRANVVPGRASALLGLRFGDPDTESEVVAALLAAGPISPRTSVRASVLSQRPVWLPSGADEALGRALGLPGRPAAGAADTNTTGALGVATVDGMGPAGGGAHAATEHLLVPSFLSRIDTLHRFLLAPLPSDGRR